MATLSQAGIYGVGNGILHPKHKNRWNVIFSGLGGATGSNASASNNLSLQLITASRPSLEFEEVQLDRYNSRAYVAGKHSFQPIQLTLEDDVTNRASTAIQTQLELQQRLIGATGPWLNTEATASSYKFGIDLNMLDGNETILETWKCEGCFIQHVEYGDLDYAEGGKVTIALTIRYDHARQILTPDIGGSAIGGILA
jgi:hypothetical protein